MLSDFDFSDTNPRAARYVFTVDPTEYNADEGALSAAYESLLASFGWQVTVRPTRGREIVNEWYLVESDGSLQILGYSVEMPAELHDDSERAWERACAGEEAL